MIGLHGGYCQKEGSGVDYRSIANFTQKHVLSPTDLAGKVWLHPLMVDISVTLLDKLSSDNIYCFFFGGGGETSVRCTTDR